MSTQTNIADQMEDLGACLRSLQTLIGCVDKNAALNTSDLYYLLGLVVDKHQEILKQM